MNSALSVSVTGSPTFILNVRPDIQVVIASYDHANLWDPEHSGAIGSAGNIARDNYGLGAQGTPGGLLDGAPIHPAVDIGPNGELNAAMRLQEQGKINLAAGSRRVHFVDNYGLMDNLNGYNGYFGSAPAGLGQGAYSNLPVTPGRLGSNGTDPIHLDTTGYQQVAANPIVQMLGAAMADNASLGLSTTSLNFGNVRIGTSSSSLGTTASNGGANFSKVQNLTFAAASGEFQGGSQIFSPLFRDPSLGSDTASKNYAYSPTNRGADAQNIGVSSSNGAATLNLAGNGVGPNFQASDPSVDFGTHVLGPLVSASLDLTNSTPDGDLGSLTDLTLLSAQLTGPDAGLFSLLGFTPGMVLDAGDLASLTLQVQSGTPGLKFATLSILTDQGADFGSAGESFLIQLSFSAVPEPSTIALAISGVVVMFLFHRRRVRVE